MTHPTDDELESMAARLATTPMPKTISPQDKAIIDNIMEAADMLRACKGRVKPLEWREVDEICTRLEAPALGGKMIVVEVDPGSGEYSAGIDLSGLCFRLIQAQYDDGFGATYSAPANFDTLEAAKAAAQADYEARVLSALEPALDQGEWDAALEAVIVNLKTYAPHQDGTGPEHDIGYAAGYHTALNRVQELKKGQAND